MNGAPPMMVGQAGARGSHGADAAARRVAIIGDVIVERDAADDARLGALGVAGADVRFELRRGHRQVLRAAIADSAVAKASHAAGVDVLLLERRLLHVRQNMQHPGAEHARDSSPAAWPSRRLHSCGRATPICLRLLAHCARRAASRAACTAGNSSATSTPMMAITTSNSTA